MLLFFGEVILIYTAKGAEEVFGDIFPLGAGGNAAFGVALLFVVFPTADTAYIFHNDYLLSLLFFFML